jgi:heme exporter protein CcmD
MMDWSADHAGFVIAAYALSLVFLSGLIIYVFSRDVRARNRLARFEKTKK